MVIILTLVPGIACSKTYSPVNVNETEIFALNPKGTGEFSYGSQDNIPPLESALVVASNQTSEHDSGQFLKETVERLKVLTHQIDAWITYADEYYEKNKPVSKYDLISYVNSMSNEINTLKHIYEDRVRAGKDDSQLANTISRYETLYVKYNDIINDIDSIRVNNFTFDSQLDIKSMTSYDAYRQTNYTTTDENFIYTFSVDISNTGSRADVVIELSGVTYKGRPVASHLLKTTIGSNESKELGERLILPKNAGQDIDKWIVSDVKIHRTRK